MRASARALPRILRKWVLAGASLSILLAMIVQLQMLRELVDRPTALFFNDQRDASVVQLAQFLTDFGKAYWLIVPSIAIFCLFRWVVKRPLYASQSLFFLASVASTGLIADILKFLFGRARPNLLFHQDIFHFFFFRFGHDYNSFPSGHTACAMAAGVAMTIICPRCRVVTIAGAIILSCTRFVTTAHYVSDVVASSMIAVVVVPLVQIVFVRFGLPLCTSDGRMGLANHRLAAKIIGYPFNIHSIGAKNFVTIMKILLHMNAKVMTFTMSGLVSSLIFFEIQEIYFHKQDSPTESWMWASLIVCILFAVPTWIEYRKFKRI